MFGDEQDIVLNLIKSKGPRTGSEIINETGKDSLHIWKACKTCQELQVRTLARRYLRLDRHVEGLARLSPSILREFLTYSVIGLASEPDPLEKRCMELDIRIHEISRFKFDLARQTVSEIMEEFEDAVCDKYPICFIIAGDIVYDMAHDVPRPERSTGKLVKGSDIDLIAVADDALPDNYLKTLDDIVYRKKYRMLISPDIREEVDYKIKRLALIKNQARFDSFKHMVAIKILREGLLIYGSETLFQTVKKILEENGLIERLDELKRQAEIFRKNAEELILDDTLDREKIEEMHLFYSAEEFEEFE